jgi:hypothetical protein
MNNHGPADHLRIASVVSVMTGRQAASSMNVKCTNQYGEDMVESLHCD